jgi:hypothetical protein
LNGVLVVLGAAVLVENDFDEVHDDDTEENFGILPAIQRSFFLMKDDDAVDTTDFRIMLMLL